MAGKAGISLTTGLEDPEKVTGVPRRGQCRRIRAADPDVPGRGGRPARAERRGSRCRLRSSTTCQSGGVRCADHGRRYITAHH